MAETVIDLFEMVEIEEKKDGRPAPARSPCVEGDRQPPPIEKPGQLVAVGANASCSPFEHTVCFEHDASPASGWHVPSVHGVHSRTQAVIAAQKLEVEPPKVES